MEIIPVEGECNLATMGLLLSMKGCAFIVAPEDNNNAMAELEELTQEKTHLTVQLRNLPQTFANNEQQFGILRDINGRLSWVKSRLEEVRRSVMNRLNVIGRVEGNFHGHLVDAAVLEVDDVGSAVFALYLWQTCGWRGIACHAQELEVALQNQIRIALGDVPYRVKLMDNGNVFLVPPPIQNN